MIEVESEPEVAASLFSGSFETARAFAAHLVEFGDVLGLIGPAEFGRLWSRHLLNSVILSPLIWPGATVADIGSGAGLPGMVIAIARPDTHVTLIEPMERRAEWLRVESDRLSLSNVTVVRARAEEARLPHPVDQVTARAVSALSKLLPLAVPLARSGGELLLMKGERIADEMEAAAKVITRLRLSSVEVLELGRGQLSEVTRVFRAAVD